MSAEIVIRGVSKQYGRGRNAVAVLQSLDLTVAPGELFFLLGPSGCGKTTLLRIIAGLIAPTSGSILLNGSEITDTPAEKRDTAMVFQNYALWPHMTVLDNVAFGPKMRGKSAAQQQQIALDKLRLVEMEAYCGRKPNQLSGGQQQRVALARALAAEPKCLLLDEPLSNLDAKLRSQMRTELRQLIKASGTTAIYVTHDQKEALSMADRVGVMHDGQLVQTAAPRTLYRSPVGGFAAEFVGQANFVKGQVKRIAPLEIETAAGLLVSNADSRFQVGAAVVCCVRSEDVMVLPDEAEN